MPLKPDIEAMLRARANAAEPSFSRCTPAEARALSATRVQAAAHPPFWIEVGEVVDTEVPSVRGPLRARAYFPSRPPRSDLPTVLLLHGGGFVLGSLEGPDPLARQICMTCNVVVFSLSYSLAPEHPFPAALDDVLGGIAWASANIEALGGDSRRLSVAGMSAGANLAIGATWLAKERGLPVYSNILIYPLTDARGGYPSRDKYRTGYLLDSEDIEWFDFHYAASKDRDDPRRSPILIPDLDRLPRTLIVTSEFDPFRDEGHALALKLAEAGVDVTLRCFAGNIHGFCEIGSSINSIQVDRMEVVRLINQNIN